ncbi:MAG TPA: acyl-CoA dehydrogenase family protein [Acidimicrobiia bacterium]|nr:acyl-CoA dehydrogenase family protein [Acidimicrobiia bacterium]
MRLSPFTEEHDLLRKTIAEWVGSEVAPHVADWEEAGDFPNDVFRRAGELGFLGLAFPESAGGQGGDYWAQVVFLEEVGRVSQAIAMVLSVQTDMATPPILEFGTPEQVERWLEPALRGELIGAIGITEPDTGSDVASIRTNARRDGDEWVLNGSKMYITNGARADFITMVVRTGELEEANPWGGISMFIVDTSLPGFSVSMKLEKAGMRLSDTALLFMDDMRLPADALLGVEGQGFKQAMWELQGERMGVSAFGVAGARAVLDEAIRYAREREAFGRPIGDFQAVSHRLAEMATEVEAVQSLVYECCDLWNRGVYATEEVAMAKLAVGQLDNRVVDAAVQTLGGAGLVEGSFISREWLGMRIGRIGGGSDEVQRQILARIMGIG